MWQSIVNVFSPPKYPKGAIPAYKAVVKDVLPKYEEFPKFKKQCEAIRTFVTALESSANVNAVSEAIDKTMEAIQNNAYTFVQNKINELGRQGVQGVQGGKGPGEPVMTDSRLQRTASELDNPFNMNPKNNQAQQNDDVWTPPAVSGVTNVETAKPDTQTNQTTQKPIPMYDNGTPMFTVTNGVYVLNPPPGVAVVTNAAILANLTTVSNAAQHLKAYFKRYPEECVDSIEAIRINNNILKKSFSNGVFTYNASVTPPILMVVLEELADDLKYLTPDQLASDSIPDTPTGKKVKASVFALVQWYLLHNNTKGIDLAEYDQMNDAIRTTDDTYKNFVREINEFISHL